MPFPICYIIDRASKAVISIEHEHAHQQLPYIVISGRSSGLSVGQDEMC